MTSKPYPPPLCLSFHVRIGWSSESEEHKAEVKAAYCDIESYIRKRLALIEVEVHIDDPKIVHDARKEVNFLEESDH